MRILSKINFMALSCLLLLLSLRSLAAIEPYTNSMKGPSTAAGHNFLTLKDEKFLNSSYNWSNITNNTVKASVSMRVIDSALIAYKFNCSYTATIKYYTSPDTVTTPPVTTTHVFTVGYDSTSHVSYKNLDTYVIPAKAYKINVTITQVNNNGFTTPAARMIELSSTIVIDRTYTVSSFTVSPTYTIDTTKLQAGWNYVVGADEYDVEWTTVNNGNPQYSVLPNIVSNSYSPSTAATYMPGFFSHNASRTTTSGNSCTIPIISTDNYLLARVRPVHYLAGGIRQTGAWSYTNGSGNAAWSIIWHQSNLNWQYSAAFAEEGKRKDVISYFDGSLRGRQTVTVNNTDNVEVAQENIYDQFGRPAASILPAPHYESSGLPFLHYIKNFNLNAASGSYNSSNITDTLNTNCELNPAALSTSSGASRYYSSLNDFLTTGNRPFNKFIPSAEGYPLSVTQYTPDNTGRIKVQGGVGPAFQPGKAPSGQLSNTTKYYYGKPEQWELDQLFGSDVGFAEHYMKNMVVDPNGQASVSYVNASGKTIATALTGAAPATMDTLATKPGPHIQSIHILQPSQFVYNATALTLSATTTYVASRTGSTPLTLSIQKLIDYYPGGTFQICSNCYYNMTVRILDDCNDVIASTVSPVQIGSKTANPTDTALYRGVLSMTPNFTRIGEYYITVEFAFDNSVINTFTDNFVVQAKRNGYLEQQFNYIKKRYLDTLNVTGLYADCQTCSTLLGGQSDFAQALKDKFIALNVDVASASGTRFNDWADSLYTVLKTRCTALQATCDYGPCTSLQDMMQQDVSPGGQYALFDASYNALEPAINAIVGTGTTPNWRLSGQFQAISDTTNATYKSELMTLPDGTVTSPYSPTFTLQMLIQYWKPSWAVKFLPFHPEYCQLQFCMNNASYENWDLQVQQIQHAADIPTIPGGSALAYNLSNTADWLLSADPFFKSGGTGVSYHNQMQADLLNYSANVLGLAGTMSVKGLPAYVDYLLYCVNTSGTTTNASTSTDTWDNCAPAIVCRVPDREWTSYAQYYFQLKQKYYTLLQNASCSSSCPVGQPLASAVPGACPLFTDFTINAGSSATACTSGQQQLTITHNGGPTGHAVTLAIYYPAAVDGPSLVHSVSFGTNDTQQSFCVPATIPASQVLIQSVTCGGVTTPQSSGTGVYASVRDSSINYDFYSGSNPAPDACGHFDYYNSWTTVTLRNAAGYPVAAGSAGASVWLRYTQNVYTTGGASTAQTFLHEIFVNPGASSATYSYIRDRYGYSSDCLSPTGAYGQQLSCILSGTGIASFTTNIGDATVCSDYTAPPAVSTACAIYAIKTPRVPNTTASGATQLTSTQATLAQDTLQAAIKNQGITACTQNADTWMARLDSGLRTITNLTIQNRERDSLRTMLIQICSAGVDVSHPQGVSDLTGDATAGSSSYTSFGNAIKGVLHLSAFTPALNPWLIDAPQPYLPAQQAVAKTISNTNADICTLLAQLGTKASAAGVDLYTYLTNTYTSAMTLTPTNLADLQNACGSCRFLLAKDLTLPVFLDPGSKGVIHSGEYNTAMTALNAQFTAPLDTTGLFYHTIVANYLNQRFGFSLGYNDYATYKNKLVVDTTTLLCNVTPYTSANPDPYAPVTVLMATAVANGQADYANYITTQRAAFRNSYISTCKLAQANAYLTTHEQLYHFTLYYYDQADNLVRTIPPEGVVPVDTSLFKQIDTARSRLDSVHYVYPAHVLRTNYAFNSTNQVLQQSSPDGGTNRFWYDILSRLTISQNDKQLAANNYSYTTYDAIGRITEVGQKNQTTVNLSVPHYLLTDTLTLFAAAGSNAQITHTYYDSIPAPTAPAGVQNTLAQKNLRKRVATSTYADNQTAAVRQATYYNYDIDGNVSTLWQQVDSLGTKKIDYEYDLVSGKVNFVRYQDGLPDRFYYQYKYDADNRITETWSGTEAISNPYTGSALLHDNRRMDAAYFYYLHGPLARTELGDVRGKVQGTDYAYTLQGWLKGVNSTDGTSTLDMGNDGGSNHLTIPKDAMGYSLYYFGNGGTVADYIPVSGTNAFETIIPGFSGYNSLYNGNISAGTMNLPALGATWHYNIYQYDQLNRLTKNVLFNATGPGYTGLTYSYDYNEVFSYDRNGNVQYLYRTGNTISGTDVMDNLIYRYNTDGNGRLINNRLRNISDLAADSHYTNDIKNQATDNYTYDATGNLAADSQAGISNIDWSVYGKINTITKTSGNINYFYNTAQQRTKKRTGGINTYYVRDAQGNTLAVYDNKGGATNWREQHLYGSSRLGMWLPNLKIGTDSSYTLWDTLGHKRYELTNHLGNVMATITDRRLQQPDAPDTSVAYFKPDVANAQEYYAFGSLLPGRTYTANANYRYGFNGKENDNEVKGAGNEQDYGMRIYDPRVGRFLSVDPLQHQYPELTPYQFSENTPIQAVDLDGKEADFSKAKVNLLDYNKGDDDETKINVFALNTALTIYNGVVDMVEMGTNYNPVTNIIYKGKGYGKLYNTGKTTVTGAYDWTTNTTWGQKGQDLIDALTNPHTYEAAAALLVTHKLGKLTGPVVEPELPALPKTEVPIEGTGEYKDVGGHHVHAKAAFKEVATYDPNKGFSISQKLMKDLKLDHNAMTQTQRRLFRELANSGKPNTLIEQTRIAKEALMAGGATEDFANDLLKASLENLKNQNVTAPSNIPWNKTRK